ncbi:hypothetical protein SLEP1_g39337 [Rubroshorea leprosula]|uniref:Uncharacterized protein n=1 Tax=Rubroshorea leprosula TaxID=152421 RepID=A0AAV5L0L7_9ROSI|nr:hypothetical protein SLEP1_g39337 [Rubroshorea leprosula]
MHHDRPLVKKRPIKERPYKGAHYPHYDKILSLNPEIPDLFCSSFPCPRAALAGGELLGFSARELSLQLPPAAKLARPGLLAENLGNETEVGETEGSDEIEG